MSRCGCGNMSISCSISPRGWYPPPRTGISPLWWIWCRPELRRKNLFPAGRLDKDTEGFVLITDDGAFAHRILAPKNKLPKRYTAVLDHRLDPAVIGEFEKGVDIGGGDHTLPAELTILENGENPPGIGDHLRGNVPSDQADVRAVRLSGDLPQAGTDRRPAPGTPPCPRAPAGN